MIVPDHGFGLDRVASRGYAFSGWNARKRLEEWVGMEAWCDMRNEGRKTLVFIGLAVVAMAVAWGLRSVDDPLAGPVDMVGKPIVAVAADSGNGDADGHEALAVATGIEIVRWDDVGMKPFRFAVQENVDGQWVIPSHSDYPADAKEQFGRAAAALTGVTILSAAGDSPSLHREFGLLDPTTQSAETGATAEQIGTRITFRDRSGREIVDLIVGGEDKKQRGTRYVRYAGKDAVYQIELDLSQYSTRFEDWIEKDLLLADGMLNLRRVAIDDYSVDGDQKIDHGMMLLAYDDRADPRWLLEYAMRQENGKPVEASLAADEELAAGPLDLLRASLGELAIVDVRRKPDSVQKVLSGEQITSAEMAEFQMDLQSRGFYLADLGDGGMGLFSSEGQIQASLSDGVEYVLQFGKLTTAKGENLAAMAKSDVDADDAAAEKSEDATAEAGKNRYLFVRVGFDPDAVEPAVVQPLPEAPVTLAEDADEVTRKEYEEKLAAYTVVKERVESANRVKVQEYESRVAEGQERAEMLQGRFRDWYYVVSDTEYQKIHLGWDKIVRKKESGDEEQSSGILGGMSGIPGISDERDLGGLPGMPGMAEYLPDGKRSATEPATPDPVVETPHSDEPAPATEPATPASAEETPHSDEPAPATEPATPATE